MRQVQAEYHRKQEETTFSPAYQEMLSGEGGVGTVPEGGIEYG